MHVQIFQCHIRDTLHQYPDASRFERLQIISAPATPGNVAPVPSMVMWLALTDRRTSFVPARHAKIIRHDQFLNSGDRRNHSQENGSDCYTDNAHRTISAVGILIVNAWRRVVVDTSLHNASEPLHRYIYVEAMAPYFANRDQTDLERGGIHWCPSMPKPAPESIRSEAESWGHISIVYMNFARVSDWPTGIAIHPQDLTDERLESLAC